MRSPRSLPALAAALALLGASAAPALAQSCGGAAGPSASGGGGTEGWLRAGEGSLRVSGEYEARDRSYRGHHRVANDFHETVFMARAALDLRLGLTDDWTGQLFLTYPRFAWHVKPPGGERDRQRFRGPGDTSVLLGRAFRLGPEPAMPAHASPMPEDLSCPAALGPGTGRPLLSLWGGLSLPTGESQAPDRGVVTRDISVSNLQVGSGTFDPLLRARLELPVRFGGLFAEVAARVPLYGNRHGYRTGATLSLAVGADAPLAQGLRGSLALSYLRARRDSFRGDPVAVGGAWWVYATPGLALDLGRGVTLDAGVRLTLVRRTETKLSDSARALVLGLTLRF